VRRPREGQMRQTRRERKQIKHTTPKSPFSIHCHRRPKRHYHLRGEGLVDEVEEDEIGERRSGRGTWPRLGSLEVLG